MTIKRPTGSVTGRQGWRWNRWRASQEDDESAGGDLAASPGSRPSPGRNRPGRNEVQELRERVATLEAEIERKECELHHVRRQYERLLDERNRKLAERDASEESSGSRSWLGRLVRWTKDR